jgi:hypothetical protein
MKKILFTLTIGLFLVACGGGEAPAPTSQVAGATASHYGEMIDSDGAISAADLTSKMEGQTSMDVKFEGDIIQTCRKKGCWMSIDLGEQADMTVTFKDYAFFVPVEGVDGKTMIAEGVCSWDTLDVDWLQHLAEDAGKTKEEIAMITEPEFAMAFEATGVIIKDYADAAE